MQAASALGKAEDLIRWSLDLRSLQLPRLPSAVPFPWAAPALKPKTPSAQGAAAAQGVGPDMNEAAPGRGDSGGAGVHDCSGGEAAGAGAERCAHMWLLYMLLCSSSVPSLAVPVSAYA